MEIRAYSKSELAQLYAPEVSVESAVARLRRWIEINQPLRHSLSRTGYRPLQRIFTIKQVQLIVEAFGEP